MLQNRLSYIVKAIDEGQLDACEGADSSAAGWSKDISLTSSSQIHPAQSPLLWYQCKQFAQTGL
jgi:hypothetical protein